MVNGSGLMRCMVGSAAVAGVLFPVLAAAQDASQGAYMFSAPPSAQANRVYSVNRKTGEMNACQFERPDSSQVGVTRCFTRGEGAGAVSAGNYQLVPDAIWRRDRYFPGQYRHRRDEHLLCARTCRRPAAGGNEAKILCTPPGK